MQDDPKQPDISVDDIDTAPSYTPPSAADVSVSVGEYVQAIARISEENSSLKQELEETKAKVRTTEILDDLMKPYAKGAYIFMCSYSAFVGVFLLLNAFGCFKKSVDPAVLEILVGSTAVTVIGLVGMVLTGIFVGARRS